MLKICQLLMADKRQNEVIVDSAFGQMNLSDFKLLHSNLSETI